MTTSIQRDKLEGEIASNVDVKTMQMAAVIAENQRLKVEVLLLKKFASYLSKPAFSKIRFYC